MKSKSARERANSKRFGALLRAVILAAIAALVYFIGRRAGVFQELPKLELSGKAVLRGILILLAMFAAEGLILFLLSLPNPKNNRLRTMLSLAKNVLRYAVILAAICVALTIFNVDIVTILAGLGILALIIGFGAESLIADIVTGMFILIDNQYNIGDIIEVDGFRGTVTEINVRSTVLTDVGGNVKIINNSDMKNVLNRSDNSSKSVSEFPIPYETDIMELEKKIPALLQEIFENNQPLMLNVPEYLGVNKLDDSAVILRFVVEVREGDIYAGSRALNHDLFVGMRKLGVEVPFPQIDVHQK
ncbi:MAG: mechanosensitive ion channel family protein [Clostridia bacterium]|nr:mechanosensitive ion channel family protein [Clostridia bacterium]